jgi:hypothetical protein
MRQTAHTVFEVVVLILAMIGAFWLVGQIVKLLIPEPQPAPVVNVTINMPESKPKELTAGDHAKGIIKTAWDKFVEGLFSLPFPGK